MTALDPSRPFRVLYFWRPQLMEADIVGTLKSVKKRCVFRYFGEFQYRFNRRFRTAEMQDRLAAVVKRSTPLPYKPLAIADEAG